MVMIVHDIVIEHILVIHNQLGIYRNNVIFRMDHCKRCDLMNSQLISISQHHLVYEIKHIHGVIKRQS